MQAERPSAARRAAVMGLLLALAVALNLAESFLPALPMLPPGVKPGLSNIVTIYGLFYLGAGNALCIAVLKSTFVLITRGVTAGALSVSGGILSVLAMLAVRKLLTDKEAVISISGAVFHNFGQLCVAAFMLKSTAVFIICRYCWRRSFDGVGYIRLASGSSARSGKGRCAFAY